jgi:hypothetical protein
MDPLSLGLQDIPFTPDLPRSAQLSARTLKAGPELERGIKMVTTSLKPIIPMDALGIKPPDLKRLIEQSFSSDELKTIARLKNNELRRAFIIDRLTEDKHSVLGMVVRSSLRGPHSIETIATKSPAVPEGATDVERKALARQSDVKERVNVKAMPKGETKRRFISGRGIGDEPMVPLQEGYDEALERARREVYIKRVADEAGVSEAEVRKVLGSQGSGVPKDKAKAFLRKDKTATKAKQFPAIKAAMAKVSTKVSDAEAAKFMSTMKPLMAQASKGKAVSVGNDLLDLLTKSGGKATLGLGGATETGAAKEMLRSIARTGTKIGKKALPGALPLLLLSLLMQDTDAS